MGANQAILTDVPGDSAGGSGELAATGMEEPESAHTMDQVTIKRTELDSEGQLPAQSEQA